MKTLTAVLSAALAGFALGWLCCAWRVIRHDLTTPARKDTP
ncbi:hypothetical protein [Nocardiopsis synnemataformans]